MKRLTTLIAAATLAFSASVFADEPKEITILLDKSKSNALLIDPRFNKAASRFVDTKLNTLKAGDSVVLKSFGSLVEADNFADKRAVIKRNNLGSIKKYVRQTIETLHEEADAQGSTNLIAWFGRNTPTCSEGSRVIVLTDGIEASEYVDPNKLLAGEQSLPAPNEFVNLEGCSITFFGLGVGVRDSQMNTLRREWKAYFDKAGAQFTAVIK